MKKNKSSKKITAVVLAIVMVLASLPLMMFSAIGTGSYDPAPYWGNGDNNSAVNTNFIATVGTDGSVSISFPKAEAAPTWDTYAAETKSYKSITNYIFTLTKLADDGTRVELWSENFENRNYTSPNSGGVFTITEGAEYPNKIYYAPGGLTNLQGFDIEASYDAGIVAVDSDGWVSDAIHTRLTSVPYYNISDDFSPNESWVVREMLLFEQKGTSEVDGSSQSDAGATSPDYSERQNADAMDVNGKMAGMGYNGSAAYRYWIANAYNGTPYVSTTTWSRDHYDFKNAEEVWFYVDLSRINVNKFAFTLSANEKSVEHWRDDTTNYTSHYGTTFSTASAGGKNTGIVTDGIYIQNADGLWESSSMTNGYFTHLSGYKGFVRIPLKYFILQTDQYITADNDLAGWSSTSSSEDNLESYVASHHFAAGSTMVVPNSDGTTRTMTTENISYNFSWSEGSYDKTTADAFKVNPAGTSITDALIIYTRNERANWGGFIGIGAKQGQRDMGTMISDANVVSKSGTTYTVTSPQYAIQDLVSAGVQIAEWSADSVHKSFYIDQVMFCKKNIGSAADFDANGYVVSTSSLAFPSESNISNNNSGTYGIKMAGFYDRTKEVPKAVAQYILQYFGEIPSLDDINAKALIDDIIVTYIDCFPGCTTVEQAIASLSTSYPDAYNRYIASQTFINTYVGSGLNTTSTAVESFESRVEALPTPDFASHTDPNLQNDLKQLMALYETFNLSHFELLGADAEAKFLELYDLVMGEEVKTGQSIGAYPYIPFNDFESNYSYGQKSDMYYDDYPAYESNKPGDINSTGNFTTYVSSKTINQSAAIGTAIGWSPADYRPTGETLDSSLGTYFSRMDAQITDKGFADSLGATININGDLNSTSDVKLATLSTTYLGAEADTWGNLPGLDLSALAVKTDSANGTDAEDVTRYGAGVIPNSFVMYVDFTNVETVNMNIKFILSDSSGNDVNCYFCGGTITDTPVIYQLDENGNWEAQNLSSQTLDNSAWFGSENAKALCSIGPSSLNKLEGYKGFIRIPLSNFRVPKPGTLRMDYYVFDNLLDDGYKIKQAKITFWDYTGANVGKNLTIDALGFTYDPACTNRTNNQTDCNGELNQDNGIYVKNMDEYFGVKTVDSSNFEKMVSTIDPYATEQEFKDSFDDCITAYLALSDYQKTIPEVKYSYETLLEKKYRDLYRDYANEIQKEQWQPLYSATTDDGGNVTETAAQKLLNDLATVSETAKEYSIADESLSELYTNYRETYLERLGFSSIEDAEKVINMYELGYHRLSMDDRASISDYDFGRLTNAYNAAKRVILIEDIISDVETFKANITRIYGLSSHTDDDADRIPDTEDSDAELRTVKYAGTVTVKDENDQDVTVNALGYYTGMYGDISVFGKKLLNDDTDVAAAYMNMYDAAEAICDNSTAITPMAGNSVPGGIITYEGRMEEAYADAKAKIEARTVIDTVMLNEIEYCLGQYEVFLRRYSLVDELNYDYVQLALLFPTADLATTTTEAVLTNADENPVYSYTTDVDLTYVAARLNRTVSVYLVTDYKWSQVAGATHDFGYYTVNGTTGTDGSVVYTKLGDYANGATADINPVITVDETAAKNVPTGAEYEGTVKIMAFDSALITEGVDMTTLEPVSSVEIPVKFNSVNGAEPLSYVVQIPTDQNIEWDTTDSVDVSYTVESAVLPEGTSLDISVVDADPDGDGKANLTAAEDNSWKMEYTATGFETQNFAAGTHSNAKGNNPASIQITQETWDASALGRYETQLTYTVTLNDTRGS